MLNEFGMEQMLRLDSAGASKRPNNQQGLWFDRYVGILAAMFPTLNSFGFTATLETTFVLLFALHWRLQATTLARLIDARVAHEKDASLARSFGTNFRGVL